jgi:hypothetical protein
VGECAVWVYVEDGERVFAVVDAAFGEDDGDEVDAGGSKEREGRRLGEELLSCQLLEVFHAERSCLLERPPGRCFR